METNLFIGLCQAMDRQRWSYQRVAEREVAEAAFEAHHTRVRLHVQVFAEIEALSVVGYTGHEVPVARRGLIAEALMRLNQELTIGNFEMDWDQGRVFFRVTNIFPQGQIIDEILVGMVQTTVTEIDRLTPLLTLLLRMETAELGALNLKLFLCREDLLPPSSTLDKS
jgi:hypothetical protein